MKVEEPEPMAVSLFGTGNKKKQIPGKEISSVLTMPVG